MNVLYGQQIHYYSDTLQKLRTANPTGIIHQGINSYIVHKAIDDYNSSVSAIIKTDTSGKVIWTAYPTNFSAIGLEPVNIAFSEVTMGSEGNLYSTFSTGKIGKIRSSNGSVDWIVPLQPVIGGSRTRLLDYDAQSIVFANAAAGINKVRFIRYNKTNGQHLGYTDLYCNTPGILGIHIAAGGNIYLANRDSLYKYTSFDDPTLEWRVSLGTDQFYDIQTLVQDGNHLFVFGNREMGFHNGIVSCVDLTTGTLTWVARNGGAYDLLYADHKIKNGFLYTSWRHLYFGSVTGKCFINKINISTGAKIWEANHAFRTQPVLNGKEEAMMSMDIDDNETLFLTGYGLPDGQSSASWGFMKVRGSDGVVVGRNFMPGSSGEFSFPAAFSNRLVNGKLYATGLMPGYIIASALIDTVNLASLKTNSYTATIQFPSTITGIRNVSQNKKVIVKKIGKSLRVEMTDLYLNKIWEKTIRDTMRPYEAMDVIGVNDSANSIYITARRYQIASSNHFYFAPAASDSFLLIAYDTLGNVINRVAVKDNPFQNPYQFFVDSTKRTWFARVVGVELFANNYPNPTLSVGGRFTVRPYTLIKPTTFFPYTKDTILLFREPNGTLPAALLKTWPGYLHAQSRIWPILTIRWINSTEREDKDNFYVVAKDSSLKDMILKYNVKDSSIVWQKKFDSTILTLKGYCLNGSFYAISSQGNDVLIRKFNGTTGDVQWTKKMNVLPGHILKVGDFALSKQRQKITLAGHLIDTTMTKDMSKLYIVLLDTSGNELSSYITDGYKAWQNKGTTIQVGQDGQTLVAGQLSDSTYGYAGFIYEADTNTLTIPVPVPVVTGIVNAICSDTTLQTGKIANPMPAPYTISVMQDNSIPLTYKPADSSFKYSIANAGNHNIRVSFTYGNSVGFKDNPFITKATPAVGAAPTQTGNVVSAPIISNAYRWYLNGNLIAGATQQTLTITQSGLYSYDHTIDGCTAPKSTAANIVFTAIIDPTNNNAVITISPNPSNGYLIIKNLNAANQYAINISDINGKQVKGLTWLSRGTSTGVNLPPLAPGNYVLQLWNVSRNKLIGHHHLVLVR